LIRLSLAKQLKKCIGKVAARVERGKVVTWACKACALKQTAAGK
jgi:hypothetical protein